MLQKLSLIHIQMCIRDRRPSGTEPKIKIYCTAKGKDKADAQAIADKLMGWADRGV